MKLFLLIATVVAYTCAAPALELQHPSPVNPSVLVALKPEEKIFIITDPKEISKFKRETRKPFYPTVIPDSHKHHITKREHNLDILPKPQILPAIFQAANVEQEESKKAQGLPAIFSPSKQAQQEAQKENIETPPSTTETLPPCESDTTQQKRDIPVPLVPKFQHPEESPKDNNEEISQANKKEQDHPVPQTLPVKGNDHPVIVEFQQPQILPLILKESETEDSQHKSHIPVPLVPEVVHAEDHVKTEVVQKPQILPLILKETETKDSQHKRDIPVPLVPKFQHPEESSKESNEEIAQDDKKEQDQPVPQTLPVVGHDHPALVEFQKPQILPLILKESETEDSEHKTDIPVPLVPKIEHAKDHIKTEDAQKPQTLPLIVKETETKDSQYKRDIPVPLIPKFQHPEESPKKSNEEIIQADKIELDHPDPQTLPVQDQVIPAIVGFQKPQILPLILKESKTEDSQHKVVIPEPLVLKVENAEESSKEIDHPVPVTLPTHNQVHPTIGLFQKPQTLPLILDETTLDAHQHKRDIPEPLVSNIPDISSSVKIEKDLNENKKTEVNSADLQKSQTLISKQEVPKIEKEQNEKDVKSENHRISLPHNLHQALQAHNYQHPTSELNRPVHNIPQNQEHNQKAHNLPASEDHAATTVSQKPQTLPALHHAHIQHAVLKQSTGTKSQQEPAIGHEANKPINDHPNNDEVQVEDLSEIKPLPKSTDHAHLIQKDHKPSVDDHTTSTTEHPLIRRRPVSVAELFARTHDN